MSQHSSASAMAPECGARFVCQERSSSDWPSRRFGPLECTSGPWTSTASAHRSAHRSSPAGSAAAFMACTCQGGRFCYARYHPFSAKVSKLLAPSETRRIESRALRQTESGRYNYEVPVPYLHVVGHGLIKSSRTQNDLYLQVLCSAMAVGLLAAVHAYFTMRSLESKLRSQMAWYDGP